jgi:hypothetical protein
VKKAGTPFAKLEDRSNELIDGHAIVTANHPALHYRKGSAYSPPAIARRLPSRSGSS